MNELIKIKENNGISIVSARDLYEFLEPQTRFNDWIIRMLEYGFIDGVDYSKMSIDNQQYTFDYAISIDCAKEISMLQRSDKGKQARLYFIEMEKVAREKRISLPTRLELAQMVVEAEKEISQLKEDIEEKKPLVRFAESVQKVDGNILLRQLAKHISNNGGIKVGQNRLFEWMRVNGYMSPKNEPYQKYVDMGLFGYHQNVISTSSASFPVRTTTVTGKGQVYFLNKYIEAQENRQLNLTLK